MRNLKRVLSLALALVMVLGMMVIGTSAATYTDAEEITYTEAVEVMSALGILDGNPDGTFAPKDTLTREQAAKILAYVCLGTEADEYLTGSAAAFDDVAATKWSAKYVAYCKNLGIINGVNTEQTLFNPTGTLKVVEFAKMLLVAAGIDGEYTGASWMQNVKDAVAKTAMAYTDIKITKDEITREQACELALAAMKSGGTTTRYYYVVNTGVTNATRTSANTHGAYTSPTDAYVLADIMNTQAGSTIVEVINGYVSTGTLLASVHKMGYGRGTDDFGRPATIYTKARMAPMVFTDTPVMSDTTVIKAADLYNTLGVNAVIYAAGSARSHVTTIADQYWVVGGTNSADYAVSDKNVNIGGNGVLTEIYAIDTNAYIVVQVAPQLAQVSAPTKTAATNTNGAYTTYTLNTVYSGVDPVIVDFTSVVNAQTDVDNFVSDVELAKDAWVLVYGNASAGYTITAANAVTGTLTSYNTAKNQYTIDGTTYAKNMIFSTDISGNVGAKKVYFFDNYGYLAGVDSVAGPATTYAVMTQIVKVNNASNGSIGSAGSQYMEAELVYFDGSSEIVKVATFQGTTGTVYEVADWISDIPTYFNNTIVEYSVNDKGLYVLKGLTADVTNASATLADSVAFDGTALADNDTKFIVRTGAGTQQDPYKYAAYTGYANLPVKTLNTGAVVTGLNNVAPKNTSVAALVYVTATLKTTSSDNRTQAFVYGAPTYNYVSSTNAYNEYPVIINGEVTTLKVATGVALSAGTMYTINTVDAKGYVSAVTSVAANSIATAAKSGIVELTTGGWKTYTADTTVTLIDAVAGTVSTTDITALDATGGVNVGNVYVTYVKAADGSNTPAIAAIIAVKA